MTVHREEFNVVAHSPPANRSFVGNLTVYLGSLLIAEIRLQFSIATSRPAATSADASATIDHASPYRRIFPSYSSRDEFVVKQAEAFAHSLGDEYLLDVLHVKAV